MLLIPKCFERRCVHFIGVTQPDPEVEENEYITCTAFPNGIPDEISYGDNLHLTPISGQGNNIVYEPEV